MQCARLGCINRAHPKYAGLMVPYCTLCQDENLAWSWKLLCHAGSAET